MNKRVLNFSNKIDDVDEAVIVLKSGLEDVLTSEALIRLEICLAESLANLAIHGQSGGVPGESEIQLNKNKNGVEILLKDPIGAQPFDPRVHVQVLADIDPTSESGRGLGLIWECADHVDYEFADQRNQFSFSIRNRPQEGTNDD